MAFSAPTQDAKADSNCLTRGPVVSQPLSRTSVTALISSRPIMARWNGMKETAVAVALMGDAPGRLNFLRRNGVRRLLGALRRRELREPVADNRRPLQVFFDEASAILATRDGKSRIGRASCRER